MTIFRLVCLVFLPFYMMSVQAAPRHSESNILFLDETKNPSVEQRTTDLSPKPVIISNKSTREITRSKKQVNRFPFLDDMRQNWGILVNETDSEEEDENSYKRPINIPKPTETPVRRMLKESRAKPLSAVTPPSAIVSGNPNFTVISGVKKTNVKPTTCDVALIVCCMRNSNIENCFLANGCFRKVNPTNACQKNELNVILKKMKDYYS